MDHCPSSFHAHQAAPLNRSRMTVSVWLPVVRTVGSRRTSRYWFKLAAVTAAQVRSGLFSRVVTRGTVLRVGLATACVLVIGCGGNGASKDSGPKDGPHDTVSSPDERDAAAVDGTDVSSTDAGEAGPTIDASAPEAPQDGSGDAVDAADGGVGPLADWSAVHPCGVFGWFPAVSSVAFSADGQSVAQIG